MTQNTVTHQPDTKLTKTEAQVQEIKDLLRSGKSDFDIVRHIAGQIDVAVNADARLACIKFMSRSAVLLNSTQTTTPTDGLGKRHLDQAMVVIKAVMEDFLQQNPYHAEYSFAAIYERPSYREKSLSDGSTWHYGAKASSILWAWPKIETVFKAWLTEQPVTKPHETMAGDTYRLVAGQCNVSILDSHGKVILKNEFASMPATVKTKGDQITSITIK